MRLHLDGASGGIQAQVRPLWASVGALQPHLGLRATAVRHDARLSPASQFVRVSIVGVNHRNRAFLQALEKPGLSRKVRLPSPVKIQVIARQIGKDRRPEGNAIHPL